MLSGLDLASALQSPAPTWFSGCSSGLTTVLNFFSMQLPAEGVQRAYRSKAYKVLASAISALRGSFSRCYPLAVGVWGGGRGCSGCSSEASRNPEVKLAFYPENVRVKL